MRYKKAVCVLLKDLSRGAPENGVAVRLHQGTELISLHNKDTELELGREEGSLWDAVAFVMAQASPDPSLLCGSQGQEHGPEFQLNTFPGKTHPHPSPYGNKQQLMPWCLQLFALLSGGPQEKSRPPSSWENMLQKENEAIICTHIRVRGIKLI